jgi:hypothetical protein
MISVNVIEGLNTNKPEVRYWSFLLVCSNTRKSVASVKTPIKQITTGMKAIGIYFNLKFLEFLSCSLIRL